MRRSRGDVGLRPVHRVRLCGKRHVECTPVMHRLLCLGLAGSSLVPDAVGAAEATGRAVKQTDVYPLDGADSPIEALPRGKGLDDRASPSWVAIFSTKKGLKMAAAPDLTKIREGPAAGAAGDGSKLSSRHQQLIRSVPLIADFAVV